MPAVDRPFLANAAAGNRLPAAVAPLAPAESALPPTLDIATMQKRRATIVRQSTVGINALFKAAGVTPLQGHGKLLAGNKVEFTDKDGKTQELTAKHVVLAAGSIPTELRSLPFDGDQVIDSWGALELTTVQ